MNHFKAWDTPFVEIDADIARILVRLSGIDNPFGMVVHFYERRNTLDAGGPPIFLASRARFAVHLRISYADCNFFF